VNYLFKIQSNTLFLGGQYVSRSCHDMTG